MYTLYIANKNYSSWSLRPWILMRVLGIPFEEVVTPFQAGSNWEPFRIFSPSGLVPCLSDNDIAIWDSLAIAEYLAESHEGVWPKDRRVRSWARCVTAEMHSGFSILRDQCPMSCGVRIELNGIPEGLQKDIDRLDELWTFGLSEFGGPFLGGELFTAVDAFYLPVVFRCRTYGLPLSDTSHAYIEHMCSLPEVEDWLDAALNEPWREPGHEEDCVRYGRLIDDRRVGI